MIDKRNSIILLAILIVGVTMSGCIDIHIDSPTSDNVVDTPEPIPTENVHQIEHEKNFIIHHIIQVDENAYGNAQNIKVGAYQKVTCGSGCNIDCLHNCEVYCGSGCNIDCGDSCTVVCGSGCNIAHGERCSITHGYGCNQWLAYPD